MLLDAHISAPKLNPAKAAWTPIFVRGHLQEMCVLYGRMRASYTQAHFLVSSEKVLKYFYILLQKKAYYRRSGAKTDTSLHITL